MLVGAHQQVSVTFNDMPERRDDSDVLQILNAAPARSGGAGPAAAAQNALPPERQPLTNTQLNAQVYEFLIATARSCA